MFRKPPDSGVRRVSSSSSSAKAAQSFLSDAADYRHGTTQSAPPVFIQRLIILHEGLMPLLPSELQHQTGQRRGISALSEDASLEEHGEFILYYYNHSLHYSRDGTRPQKGDESNTSSYCMSWEDISHSDHATEDAVRFAGICRALRSLPQALQPQNINSNGKSSYSTPEDEVSDADVVHLTESTLVFVPLELGGDIIAIAQIPRAINHIGFGADPSAMARSIRRTHTVFSLMFAGGIHRRLLRAKHLEDSIDLVLDDNPKNKDPTLKVKCDAVQKVETDCDGENLENTLTENFHHNNSRQNMQKLSASTFDRENRKENSSSFVDYRYGGIEELFNLRREYRKLLSELRYKQDDIGSMDGTDRWDSHSDAADLLDKAVSDVERSDWEYRHTHCKRRIDSLLKQLPLTKLRVDLIKFYDQWLSEIQDTSELIQGGAGSCVVNMLPSPIPRGRISSALLDPTRGQHPPHMPNPVVYLAAVDFMKSMIYEEVPKLLGRHESQLSGMSFFDQNRHILSECISNRNSNGKEESFFSAETSCMIVEYFRKNQKKCNDDSFQYVSFPKIKGKDNDKEAPFVRWMSNLSTRTEETSGNSNMQASSRLGYGRAIAGGSYVSHPSLVSDTDGCIISLFVPKIEQHVWLQRVTVPRIVSVNATDDDDDDDDEEIETYVAMYEHPEFIFLLFFDRPRWEGDMPTNNNEIDGTIQIVMNGNSKLMCGTNHAMIDTLSFLADKLTVFCNTCSSYTIDAASNESTLSKNTFQGVDGMDIICIDTSNNNFVLMSQHDLSSDEFQRITHKSSNVENNNSPFKSIQKLFSNSPKLKERDTSSCPPLPPSKYSSVLDCRHRLAAYLPLEIIHALDDVFNELRRTSNRGEINASKLDTTPKQGNNNDGNNDESCLMSSRRKSNELCTYLPQGWVWGRSIGNIDLYLVLDTAKFATINDVQKAVALVQERLIQNMT